ETSPSGAKSSLLSSTWVKRSLALSRSVNSGVFVTFFSYKAGI
ncbi:MAG: hypothetical protein ACI8W1_000746, partial [Candidatus Azotimanducaceae bacterium]